MAKKVIIISNGRLGDPAFFRNRLNIFENTFIICCDGAIRYLDQLNVQPDLIMGDMDSVDGKRLEKYSSCGVKILKYNVNKDETDTELALKYAIGLKPESIEIWGALGGRIDHALANLFLLDLAERTGIKTSLIDEYCEIFAVEKEASLNNAVGQTVSLFVSGSKAEGITLNGFKYSLNNENLEMGSSRGISNIIVESPATIRIKSGSLLVIRYWRKDFFPEAI
ncbi:MAG: thiamine diphosphokinase [Smithella sp.]